MVDKGDPDRPSLELPSFRLGRRKRRDPEPAAPVDEAEPAPAPPRASEPATAASGSTRIFTEETPDTVEDDAPAEPAQRGRPRPALPRLALPRLGAVPAALTTGLVVGLLTVGLVWGSQGVCEVVRGTSSCGNAGFLLLVAVFVVAGWAGGALLRAFGVTDGGSTSFLAMGLVAVVVLLFLGDRLFAWWMVVAVPGVAIVAFVVSHRLTTAMVEPGGREMHR